MIHQDQRDEHDGLKKISLDPNEQFAQHGVLTDWQLPHLMGFEAERKGNLSFPISQVQLLIP